MDFLISMYIDDELDIDDKMVFVEHVHADRGFKDQTIELLQQEKIICADVVDRVPKLKIAAARPWWNYLSRVWKPAGLLAAGFAAAVLIIFLSLPTQVGVSCDSRFVIYRPDVSQVDITGSFTGWKRIPMHRIGSSGYWDITLYLPKGEHRFTYILEGRQRFADPTIPTREKDDFGGENSIIVKEV